MQHNDGTAFTYGNNTEVHQMIGGTVIVDSDGDGVFDSQDAFPNDPTSNMILITMEWMTCLTLH